MSRLAAVTLALSLMGGSAPGQTPDSVPSARAIRGVIGIGDSLASDSALVQAFEAHLLSGRVGIRLRAPRGDYRVILSAPNGSFAFRFSDSAGTIGIDTTITEDGDWLLILHANPDTRRLAYEIEVRAADTASMQATMLRRMPADRFAAFMRGGRLMARLILDSLKTGEDSARTFVEVGRELAIAARYHESAQMYLEGITAYERASKDSIAESHLPALYVSAGMSRNPDLLGTVLNKLGTVYTRRGELRLAIHYLIQLIPYVRDRPEELAYALNRIGSLYTDRNRPDSALVYFRRALRAGREARNAEFEGWTLAQIGNVLRQMGQPDSALVYLRRSLAIQQQRGAREAESEALRLIGEVQHAMGRSDSALALYHHALRITRERNDLPGQARVLAQIGTVLVDMGRPDSAIFVFRDAMAIEYQSTGDQRRHGYLFMGYGQLMDAIGATDSALNQYRLALTAYEMVGDRAGEAVARSAIADKLWDRELYDSALAHYQLALPMHRAGSDSVGEATTLFGIALSQLGLGMRDSARASAMRALDLARRIHHPRLESSILQSLGFQHTRDHPATAVAYFDSAFARTASLRSRAGTEENRAAFAESHRTLTNDWAFAWLSLGSTVGLEASRLAALGALERGRSQGLLDLMGESPALRPGVDLAASMKSILKDLGSRGISTLSYAVRADTMVVWLTLPSSEVVMHRQLVAGKRLADDINSFFRTLDGPAALRSGIPTDVSGAAGLRIAGTDGRSVDVVLRSLSEMLLPSAIVDRLPRQGDLVVIPQGTLGLIPFAALPLPDIAATPLGILHRVRYAPAFAVLLALERRKGFALAHGSPIGAQSLVVANPRMPVVRDLEGNSYQLRPLTGAEQEGRTVARMLGTKPLTGPAASEAAILRRIAMAPVIHLATHGYAYASAFRTRSSFVALASGEQRDGLLTVGEVLAESPRLRAELVVLSACQSGRGNLTEAEGTIGLQRAFIARGARSVLVSLWSVSDDVTAELMQSFYSHWLRGVTKAEALRRAQADVRRRHPSPVDWAAFQLVGAS